MQEAHIDHSELDRLVEKWVQMPQVLKEAKRQAFEAAAPKLRDAVRAEIGGSGKVQSWQGDFVGSKGGYAAARPRAKTFAEDRKGKKTRYQVGYVTNAINSGHRWPSSRLGMAKGLKGFRTSTGRVAGKQFYEAAQRQAEDVAKETAEQIVEALMDHLEGD